MEQRLIQEFLKEGSGISVTVGLEDLRKWHKEVIADTRKELEEIVLSDKVETYPSPKQTCEILDIDPSTLWRWHKKGYLVPIEVGGKRRYRMSDIKKILGGNKQ